VSSARAAHGEQRWSLWPDGRKLVGLLLVTVLIGTSACTPTSTPPTTPATASAGGVLNVVAHQDDDLLFLNPDVLHAVRSGRRVRTVYVTAGDAGEGAAYWQRRELGVRAAYATMADVDDIWDQSSVAVAGRQVTVVTLRARPVISLAFMRLPDGDGDGHGFAANQNQSLQKLWTGEIATIGTVDGATTYAKSELQDALTALMSSFGAGDVNTLDFSRGYGDGDHSDHVTVAYLTRAAQTQYAASHGFAGFVGYPIKDRIENLSPQDYLAKQTAFFVYAAYDSHVCGSQPACAGRWGYPDWFRRQYQVGQQ
jgi:LmbE family N-acetylglucosaminyl deacetylase